MYLRLYHGLGIFQKSFGPLQLSPQFPLCFSVAPFKVVPQLLKSPLILTFGLKKHHSVYYNR